MPLSLFNTNAVVKESFESYSKFWGVESTGVTKKEPEVYQSFESELEITEGRYSIKLPLKSTSEFEPDNYITSEKCLSLLKYQSDNNPKLKEQYAKNFCKYEKEGIIDNTAEICEPGTSHYLPQGPVVKENWETSKVKIVFDGSSKYKGEPSINELLEAGPCLLPLLYDIHLRFRLGTIVITADIKPAFLQIPVAKKHQNFLRFLYLDDIFDIDPRIIVYRFTRVISGLNFSQFLLNWILKADFSKLLHQQIYENFILEGLLTNI